MRKLATKESVVKMVEQEFKKNQEPLFNDEKVSYFESGHSFSTSIYLFFRKKVKELEKQIASSAAISPRPPSSTQALIGGTEAPEVPRTHVKERKKASFRITNTGKK